MTSCAQHLYWQYRRLKGAPRERLKKRLIGYCRSDLKVLTEVAAQVRALNVTTVQP